LHQKTVLDNGLRVVTSNMPHTRSVSTCIFIANGSRYETDEQAGISHFIEHLCFRGTSKNPTAKDISSAIEGVGGILNGGTEKELTAYWCKVAKSHFLGSFDVLADMLVNSRFDTEDIEKERQVIIEEIHMCDDLPSQRVAMLIDELLWPYHPLGRDIAGSVETVLAVSRDMLLDYMAAHYQPASTVIAIAGDIVHDEVVDTVNKTLGGWKGKRPLSAYTTYNCREKTAGRLKIEKRDIEQVQLCLALPGLSFAHPERFKLDMLNIILGEGMSSRLFSEIRDKLGLAYSIASYVDHFLDTGSLIITAGVEAKKLEIAIEAILKELAKLKEIIPEEELYKAKELSKGRLILRMEDSRSMSSWIGGQEVLDDRIYTIDEIISVVDAITVEELYQQAQELLLDRNLRLAVVGPVSEDTPLEQLLSL